MSKVVLQGYIAVPDSDLSAVADELKVHIELTSHQERVRHSKWGSVTKNVERFYEISGLSE